ncbi:MAG: hypothetical protein HEQ22_14665 [Sphingopyxis sp.]|uniref:hypothetical protein n=1 Tax=Sphingopyxis sp. TaxID=1908224 RepID=UPI003D80BADF
MIVPWHRVLIHLLFIGLAAYLAHEVVWRLFAETSLIEGGRRAPARLLVILLAGAASWLFNLAYPIVASRGSTTNQADK